MSAKGEHMREDRPSVRDQFQRAHSAHLDSPILRRIWHNACGEDYPEEVNPSAFYSRSTFAASPGGIARR
jgi:hypothetical protein